MTKEQVLKALGNVKDPDLGKDLVTLNMIEDLEVVGNKTSFTVVLTTPACPLVEEIKADCISAINKAVGNDVEIDLKISSRVTSLRQDLQNILPGVKNIIAVASGKGGVGKSTISVNLALALAENGAKVGLIDADIYGPSIPLMLGMVGDKPKLKQVGDKKVMLPIEKHGIKVLSIGFLVDTTQAVVWRGPMVSSALRQFVSDAEWGELDYLIIDLPPGTGDIHLTLVQTVPVTGAVVVTTPQKIALADAEKALAMFSMNPINVPVIGIVENMAYFSPEELPDNKYYIFGRDGGQKFAMEHELPLLGQIPLVQSIREGGDQGKPAVLQHENNIHQAFVDLAKTTARYISIRNAKMEPTKRVSIVNEQK